MVRDNPIQIVSHMNNIPYRCTVVLAVMVIVHLDMMTFVFVFVTPLPTGFYSYTEGATLPGRF